MDVSLWIKDDLGIFRIIVIQTLWTPIVHIIIAGIYGCSGPTNLWIIWVAIDPYPDSYQNGSTHKFVWDLLDRGEV